jgi:hypothetical protein
MNKTVAIQSGKGFHRSFNDKVTYQKQVDILSKKRNFTAIKIVNLPGF